jgi:CRP-like cAMP-binding protein
MKRLQSGDTLTVDELVAHPLLAGLSRKALEENAEAIVRRHFTQGDYICREGEEGSTAFFIESGKAEIFVSSAIAQVKTKPDSGKSWFRKMITFLESPAAGQSSGSSSANFIPIDAPVDLRQDRPLGELGEGDIFGEMTCLNLYPRSATVRALTDCSMIEMSRNILAILIKSPKYKARIDASYKERTLNSHLNSVPLFRGLPDEFVKELRDHAELISFDPGQTICKQGEVADSFYMIRIGHVTVMQTFPGGDLVRRYLARGQFFGEIGLLRQRERTATCKAADYVEVVRILKNDFDRIVERFPAVAEELNKVAESRLQSDQQEAMKLDEAEIPIETFLSEGLMQAGNLLLLDLTKCTRCDDCVRACGAAHDGITRLLREGVKYENYLVATSCRQCRDPLCMVGCPVGSIHRGDSLEIKIEDWCIGCGLCAKQCPYDNIAMHKIGVEIQELSGKPKDKLKATVCDLCVEHAEPSCVYACPHDAAIRVNAQQLFSIGVGKDK